MFHNSSSSFGPSASLSRTTPSRTQSLIHNDENASNFAKHTNLKNHGNKTNAKTNSNSTMKLKSNSKQTFASMNAKSKTPMNTRRRAFGDISNRTNEGSETGNNNSNHGNGNGAGKVSKSNAKLKSTGFSIYTPHKEQKSVKKGLAPSSLQQIHKKFPSSTVKKKTVSFSIHTEPDLALELKEASQKQQHGKIDNGLKGNLKPIPRNEGFDDVEDIELSAGRTGLEQRELLGEELDRVDAGTERDIEEALHAIRAIHEKDDVKIMAFVDDGLGQGAIDAVALQFEDVDEDVLQSYLMFDEYKGLDLELDIGEDDEDDLLLRIDDLSI